MFTTVSPNIMAARSKEAHELAWIANGYLQSALYLAEKILEQDHTDDRFHRLVPLYLCHHSLEVLYKAALVDEGLPYPITHDLSTLRKACIASIPDSNFEVPDWLIEPTSKTIEMFPDMPAIYFGNLYERVRYASDRKRKRLEPFPDLDLSQVVHDITSLKRASGRLLIRLAWEITPDAM